MTRNQSVGRRHPRRIAPSTNSFPESQSNLTREFSASSPWGGLHGHPATLRTPLGRVGSEDTLAGTGSTKGDVGGTLTSSYGSVASRPNSTSRTRGRGSIVGHLSRHSDWARSHGSVWTRDVLGCVVLDCDVLRCGASATHAQRSARHESGTMVIDGGKFVFKTYEPERSILPNLPREAIARVST